MRAAGVPAATPHLVIRWFAAGLPKRRSRVIQVKGIRMRKHLVRPPGEGLFQVEYLTPKRGSAIRVPVLLA